MGATLKAEGAVLAEIARQEAQQRLTFKLGENIFALGILRIKAIVDFRALTTVPGMPSFVLGVVELHGAMVPVVDMGARIDHKPGTASADTRIVIIEVDGGDRIHEMGIVVDAIVRTQDAARAAA
ncbi:MAG: chemotaxis protein CheW [Sulfuritalea sp.]|jgi:purine-binding chemotaxis protein CheW|nr:chemotaxis protein CheW [Sulfuritalea sp.]